MFASFIIGLSSTALLFGLSTVIVVGLKVCLLSVKKLTAKRKPPAPPVSTEPAKKRRNKTIRTIEIDPELADRIYFKKSS